MQINSQRRNDGATDVDIGIATAINANTLEQPLLEMSNMKYSGMNNNPANSSGRNQNNDTNFFAPVGATNTASSAVASAVPTVVSSGSISIGNHIYNGCIDETDDETPPVRVFHSQAYRICV